MPMSVAASARERIAVRSLVLAATPSRLGHSPLVALRIGKNSPCPIEPFANEIAHYSLSSSDPFSPRGFGTSTAILPYSMQTPFRESLETVTLFSRERRRKRMLQFLEAFERRSWLCE